MAAYSGVWESVQLCMAWFSGLRAAPKKLDLIAKGQQGHRIAMTLLRGAFLVRRRLRDRLLRGLQLR